MNPELLSSSPDSPVHTAPSTLASPRSPNAPQTPPFGAQALAGAHAAFPSRTVVRENPLFHMDDDIIVFGGGGELENGAKVNKNGGKFGVGAFSSWVSDSGSTLSALSVLSYGYRNWTMDDKLISPLI